MASIPVAMESLLGVTPSEQNRRLRRGLLVCLACSLFLFLALVIVVSIKSGDSNEKNSNNAGSFEKFRSENRSIPATEIVPYYPTSGGDVVEQPTSADESSVSINGMIFWTERIGEITDATKLVRAEGLSRLTKNAILSSFGRFFYVRFLNLTTYYDFQDDMPVEDEIREDFFALFFDKSCVSPATLKDDRCQYFSGEKATWYEAYARCDMLGMKIASKEDE